MPTSPRSLPLLLLLLAARAAAASRSAEPSLDPDFNAPVQEPRAGARADSPLPSPLSPPAAYPAPYNPDEISPPHDRKAPPRALRAPLDLPERRPWVVVRSRAWLTNGTVSTRYNVQLPPNEVTPPNLEVFIGETEAHSLNGLRMIDSAECAPFSWLSFEFQYGAAKPSGSYKAGYWVDSPHGDNLTNLSNGATWHDPNHENDLVYGADESGYQDWAAATIYVRMLDSKVYSPESFDLRHTLDFAFGAERYRQNSRRVNLAITSNQMKFYSNASPGPIPGYDSTYQALWQGPHIGLRESLYTRTGLSFEGLALWSPFMQYRGLDYENLAAQGGGGRLASPNIEDWAHGTAIHFDLGATWTWSIVRLEAGYQRLYFYSRTGRRRYYNADGSVTDYTLDFATADISGFYAGASLRF